MKRTLLAIALLFNVLGPALAQNPQCPTRPFGDNSNACATTAFVQAGIIAAVPVSTANTILTSNGSNVHVWSSTINFPLTLGPTISIPGSSIFSDFSGNVVISSGTASFQVNNNLSTAAIFSVLNTGLVSFGGGLNETAASVVPNIGAFYNGSVASPVTSTNASVLISRHEKTNTVNTTGAQNAALYVSSVGDNIGANSQVNAIIGWSSQKGTGDTVGVWGIGLMKTGSTGTAFGGFFQAVTESATANALTIETSTANNSSVDCPYAPTGPLCAGGFDIEYSSSTSKLGAAAILIRAQTSPWDVGLAFRAGSIKTANIRDDSSSIAIIQDNGTHTHGIDFNSGTYSGSAFRSPGFSVSGVGVVTTSQDLHFSSDQRSLVWDLAASDAGINFGGGSTITRRSSDGHIRFNSQNNVFEFVSGALTATSMSVTGQYTSTVATGTAPFVVSSTTVVANLHAATASAFNGILPGANGGTNNGFMQFTGPTTSLKTYTLPDSSDSIAVLGIPQTFAGARTFTGGIILGGSSLINGPAIQVNGTVMLLVGGSTGFVFNNQDNTANIFTISNTGAVVAASTFQATDITGTGTVRANTAFSANGTAGQSVTTTVRDAAGIDTCTLIFTFGLKTGGSC